MAFKTATRTGGDFLDLRELAADGPVLALFRIIEFLPGEPDGFKRHTYPVTADVLICDGPRAGEVHLAETFKYAPANVLRGVSAKASYEQGAQPTNEVGDEIACRVNVVEKKGSQPFVGLDVPSATELAVITQVYADGAGWQGKAPAMAGAGAPAAGAASRPWK